MGGKRRIVAETGAGQHGVATATVCALLGLECVVYMGEEDMRRQRLNVFRMRLLGAKVASVTNGSRTLTDAISEAMRDWVTNVADTYYLLGSALGAHPYPMMVRDCPQGDRRRGAPTNSESRRPAARYRFSPASTAVARTPSASFTRFCPTQPCILWASKRAAAAKVLATMRRGFRGGAPGVLQGSHSYLLQDEHGQVSATHSVSAGLDYPMIGPEHAWLHDRGRAEYVAASDGEALDAALLLSRTEGIIPALESAHAVSEALRRAGGAKGQTFIVNVSGRGDKDIDIYRENLPELDQQ